MAKDAQQPASDRISTASLLSVMLLKEIRTTFRERSQIGGLVVSLAVMAFAIAGVYRSSHPHDRATFHATPASMSSTTRRASVSPTTAPAPPSPPPLAVALGLSPE